MCGSAAELHTSFEELWHSFKTDLTKTSNTELLLMKLLFPVAESTGPVLQQSVTAEVD